MTNPAVGPRSALDPQVVLATSIHAQPGVYALLVGSGVSTGAGIPTGWGVVRELVRRAAAATEPDNPDAAEGAAADAEAWWADHGDGQPLGYSNLLGALASTPGARRGLLAGFFEPSEQDLQEGLKIPGPAHRAIADLARQGRVRVIITTNFDRLIERALEEAGVSPQVVSRPDAVAALAPLQHAAVTVIKIHGDYADLDMRNTIEELDTYPQPWQDLLARVFDEYGLVITGWSADWDNALVRALEHAALRRYPLFWDSRSSNGEKARRLLALHHGTTVPAATADDLFGGLSERLAALDRLSEPPLSTALAVARLKRYLPDPTRRIDLADLIEQAVEPVHDEAAAQPVKGNGFDPQQYQQILADRRANALPLLGLLIEGVWHDRDRDHTRLWTGALHRLLQARTAAEGAYQQIYDTARHYPALLALRACGITALLADRDDVLLALLTQPTYRNRLLNNNRVPAVHALHDLAVLRPEGVDLLPRWEGNKWLYPTSHLLRADLREPLRTRLPDDDDYKQQHDRFEYRTSLLTWLIKKTVISGYRLMSGEFLAEWQWNADGLNLAEVDFRRTLEATDDTWAWWPLLGDRDTADRTLATFREELQKLRRWG